MCALAHPSTDTFFLYEQTTPIFKHVFQMSFSLLGFSESAFMASTQFLSDFFF